MAARRLTGNSAVDPHLANHTRDVGHPSFVAAGNEEVLINQLGGELDLAGGAGGAADFAEAGSTHGVRR